ncbi:MAG: heme-binding protein [Alphaproteobacteria bacterium]|nr:heme-binding protein [Alphaproteobacteria bacterium]
MAQLTLQQANAVVARALAHGKETACQPLTVAVLDAGGHLLAFQRQDGSGILRPQIATGKAWGALGLGMSSAAIAERMQSRPTFLAALAAMSDGKVVPAAGGVLIRDGSGEILGAVGISGDTSDKDEACALAGIAATGLRGDAAR